MNSMSEKYEYDATVIIPVYNGAAFIEKQLQAIAAQQTNRSFEVLVSDNGSTDNTVALVEAFNAPYPLRCVDSSNVKGPANARNVGAREARGKILVYCDSDDYVETGWLDGHLAVQDEHGPALVSGANLHNNNPVEVLKAYGVPLDSDEKVLANSTLVETEEEIPPFAGFRPSITGCNFSVPRDVYLRNGGMDCSYIAGSEETDFSWRVSQSGVPFYKTYASLVHYRLRSTPKKIFRQQRNYQHYRILLWMRFKDQGMNGPSIKYSVIALAKSLPLLLSPATRLVGAREAGANLGALEGMFQYRFRAVPERQLMNNR